MPLLLSIPQVNKNEPQPAADMNLLSAVGNTIADAVTGAPKYKSYLETVGETVRHASPSAAAAPHASAGCGR
jgi:hypothetical protein